ncbi:MAG TPA: circularly permuted type 2 ATP-grasp protein [Aeromicrobium sp.]|nr:circularly permuted type 2 ATP-grasp protein [Aeromicrobium sp.]
MDDVPPQGEASVPEGGAPKLFKDYGPVAGYDEMFAGSADTVRETYLGVSAKFGTMGATEVRHRAEALASAYLDQGVTFGVAGEERPFPLDIVPRLIEAEQWDVVDRGVQQRVKALEAFLADVYGPGEVFDDGVIPRAVVTTSPHFHRVVAGLEPPNGVRIHVAGIDLIRDTDGAFRVLEDNVRVPSGVSYVMTNRRALSAALPEVFADYRIRPVIQYSRALLAALRRSAPAGISDPTVVVLTPGVYNSVYYEHALLARTMGVELVEGRDLICRSGRVLMRTTRGLAPVHVIYRRIDDDFLDPMQFRADSALGVAGIINAARLGHVTLANAVGNGVADDKLLYTYVPDLIRYYLSEEPVLANVDTWRLGDAESRTEVLDRLGELVLKPVDGSGGKGIVIGPAASVAELEDLRQKILADPRAWIAQPVVSLSTVPTLVDQGIRPRHVDLRPFAVNDGDNVWVLPGGLTRVALPEGELIVNSSRGGGSKDTWVMARPTEEAVEPARQRRIRKTAVSSQQQNHDDGPAEIQQRPQQQQVRMVERVSPC